MKYLYVIEFINFGIWKFILKDKKTNDEIYEYLVNEGININNCFILGSNENLDLICQNIINRYS